MREVRHWFRKYLVENRFNIELRTHDERFFLFDMPVDMHEIEKWEAQCDRLGIKYALYDCHSKNGHVGYNLILETPFENNFLKPQ